MFMYTLIYEFYQENFLNEYLDWKYIHNMN